MSDSAPTRPSLLVRLRDAADDGAWSRFVDLYAPLIYGFARKRGLQDADAADLTQDALAAVAQSVRHFDYDPTRGSFRGWLFTVVRNKLRKWVARRDRQEHGSGGSGALERLLEQPAAEPEQQWDDAYERRLFDWAAEAVRASVEVSTWQAFWLTAVKGESGAAAAQALGLSVAAVHMATSRVRKRLKEIIEQLQGPSDA